MPAKKKARLNNANNPLNPTESVLASFEQVSQSTSSSSIHSSNDKLNSQPASQLNGLGTNPTTTDFNQSASQPVSKPTSLRKATFKIDSEILDSLDRYHLQLQIDLGKRNAPFKETIVELAIKNILHQAQTNPEQLLQLLRQQQQIRS